MKAVLSGVAFIVFVRKLQKCFVLHLLGIWF